VVTVNLEMAGYDVSQAEDGVENELALQLQPDLVYLMLPRVDGFTVCCRRDERTTDSVLMLTALSRKLRRRWKALMPVLMIT